MKSFLKSLTSLFTITRPVSSPIEDPTVYQIETASHKYFGKIIYQDNVTLLLKAAKPKTVKILKSNIERITIVQSDTVQQYQQWRNNLELKSNMQMH